MKDKDFQGMVEDHRDAKAALARTCDVLRNSGTTDHVLVGALMALMFDTNVKFLNQVWPACADHKLCLAALEYAHQRQHTNG